MTRTTETDPWLTPEAAASRARWSIATLWRRVRNGRLPAHTRDGRTVFAAADIDAALEVRPAATPTRGARAA